MDAGKLREFADRTRVIPVVHADSGMPVDLVLAGTGLEEHIFARAQHTIEGVRVPVASASGRAICSLSFEEALRTARG